MPKSRAVDSELERWYHSNTTAVSWPLEGFVLFAARVTEAFVRRCQDEMEHWILRRSADMPSRECEEEEDSPLAKPLDLPSTIRRYLLKRLEEFSYGLLLQQGCTSIDYDYAIALILHPIRESLYALALRRGKIHNKMIPPGKLPPEVLCAVFEHLPFRDLVAATTVCSLWRERGRAAPRLWCNLELSAPTGRLPAGYAQQLISLSRALPLSLVVDHIRPRHVERDLHEPLKRNLSRLRRLELYLDDEDAECVKVLYDALRGSPAPLLETFVLKLPRDSESVLRLMHDFFQGTAPNLTDVVLPSYFPTEPWRWVHATTFHSVRKLTTRYARLSTPVARAIQYSNLPRIFPHLTELTLSSVNTGAQLPLLDADTSLRKLTLVMSSSAPDSALLELLDPPPYRRPAGHERDHEHVRVLTISCARTLPGAVLLAATRELPEWSHVAASAQVRRRMRLSVWCGAQRLRRFEFRRVDKDVVTLLRDDVRFGGAHVDRYWDSESGLGGCKEDAFGVPFVQALRARFSGLPVGIRPVV
ncbi:hypothetical protein AURDEDRAFT_160354 [Auricularia subglabra TFB-10046 SS5]|nr:hypothetical protein AURDEDRAFT_160354 [Auricularia subglabra TFB-10046 SS5]